MCNESILQSIKVMLGVSEDCLDFDVPLLAYINSAFATLEQLGVRFVGGLSMIYGGETTWTEHIGDIALGTLGLIKTFVYLRTKLIFDPPSNSFVTQSYQSQIDEIAWRIVVQTERGCSYG